jgi:membrane-associated phospholipid phosphatase
LERNAAGRWYDRHLARLLPSSRLLGLASLFALNLLVYGVGQAVAAVGAPTNLTTAWDLALPLAPAWAVVYVLAFPYWAACYVVLARDDGWYAVMAADVAAKLLCGLCFLLFPTTNVRPDLPETAETWLLRVIYWVDAPSCLFPSIHCLESWICGRNICRRRDLPRWVRWGAAAFAGMICLSTVLIRQHVLADVAGGILVAVICGWLAPKTGLPQWLKRQSEKLDRKLFG